MDYMFDTRLPQQFWRNVIFEKNGCWIWTASKVTDGYGRFSLQRLGIKTRFAHRISFHILSQPIPAHLELDHLCKHRDCVNPAHLELVTHQENVKRGSLGATAKARKLANNLCPQGHKYDLIHKNGYRGCKTCVVKREQNRRPRTGTSNGLKTHCPKGHEYTTENTIFTQNSWRKTRRCRICRKQARTKNGV